MRSPTPWIAALLVSVLLNGALIGFLAHRSADGPSWRGHPESARMDGPPPHGGSMSSGFDVRGFLGALPEAERQQASEQLRANMESMREIGREAFAARREADMVLAADPFDPEAAQLALQRVREIRLDFEARMESSLIEVMAGLDPEVRAAALEAGRRGSFRERRRRGDRARPDEGRHQGPGR
ncbi:periplasmic heavy metal sensor [uncultured Maricaulis sp.]|uniref:periplasmic heavy metal sensor n=1 Tax=uncultured Maricaulis sp. TaxID=174710 RepID=UPI0030D8DA52|tara:strand:+ start:7954 stop:8502 length:549 start_codon:yes stop_codon:yes gene_type:complete